MKTLTIGIPTYKSNVTLLRLLESIFVQITKNNVNKIEIVISDNDPASEVTNLLSSKLLLSDLKLIRYYCNQINIGYDKNLETLKKLATGKYLNIVADDDILDLGYLDNLLQTLVNEDADIIINEFQTFYANQPAGKQKTSLSNKQYYYPPWSFSKLRELNGRFGQVSTLTFKMKMLEQIPDQPEKTNFVHLFWFYSLLEKSNVIYEKNITLFCQLGSSNFSSTLIEIISTQFEGIRAVKMAEFQNLGFRKKVIRAHQEYAFKKLRLVPGLQISQKIILIQKHYLEFLDRFLLFLVYLPLFLVPKMLKTIIAILKVKRNNHF